MKSIDKLDNRLDEIINELPSFHSDVASEQVELNKELEKIVKELEKYEEEIKEVLEKKIDNVNPIEQNPAVNDLYDKSEKYRSIIKLLGKDEDFVIRFGFDRTIYEISHSSNIDRVNLVLKTFINDFYNIGLVLDPENFNYSSFSLKYMKYFFEVKDDDNYLFVMKKFFDEIYWECPLILTHLELCVRMLVFNNKKLIVKHINYLLNKSLSSVNANKDNILDLYVKTRSNYEDMLECDAYNLVNYFKKNRNELDRLLLPSVQFDQAINSVTSLDIFNSFNDEDRIFFLNNIKSLSFDLKEYELIDKYKSRINFVIDIYNKKENLKAEEKAKNKEVNKLEKKKDCIDSKLEKLINKKNKTTDPEKVKVLEISIKQVSVELEKCIVSIKELLDTISLLHFKNTVVSSVTDASSIYDVIVLLSKYYNILHNECINDASVDKDHVGDYIDEFRHVQYMSQLTIMKNISFLDYANVKELIEKKHNMYNININIPELGSSEYETLVNNLDTLNKYNALLRISLRPEDIKIIVDYDSKKE